MQPITILFGTETGNSEYCANELSNDLKKQGVACDVFDMDDYPHERLSQERLLLIVTSTYGNGDPPVNAYELMKHLSEDAPNLTGVPFGVCGLGDSSFQLFAQCGKDFDRLLGELGGDRVLKRVDCDGDYEVLFAKWSKAVLSYVSEHGEQFAPVEAKKASVANTGLFAKVKGWFSGKTAVSDIPSAVPTPAVLQGTRDNPVVVPLLQSRLLSKEGSQKETRHYVIDITDTPLTFQPGDCFGVYPSNCPNEVQSVIDLLGEPADVFVQWQGERRVLEEVLTKSACLLSVTMRLVERLGIESGAAQQALESDESALTQYLASRCVWDALSEHLPRSIGAQELVDALRPIQPRLYSVANSPLQTPNEVHFTVETTRYRLNNREMKGVASCWLSERAHQTGIPMYLQANTLFRLPHRDTSIIMIGAGTGIAPFRAFLQERHATKAEGKNWLFFGNQTQSNDFLYEEELQGFLMDGTLDALTCAWSRDTDQKVYVQDRLRDEASMVWEWIEQGAVVYVCGDASGMAPGVHAALVTIVERHGVADGEQFLQEMEASQRYLRDVY